MNLFYVYSTRYDLLAKFYSGDTWGVPAVGLVFLAAPTALPKETQTALVLQQKTLIVKRMT